MAWHGMAWAAMLQISADSRSGGYFRRTVREEEFLRGESSTAIILEKSVATPPLVRLWMVTIFYLRGMVSCTMLAALSFTKSACYLLKYLSTKVPKSRSFSAINWSLTCLEA